MMLLRSLVEQYVEYMKNEKPERFQNFLVVQHLTCAIVKLGGDNPFTYTNFTEEVFILHIRELFPDLPVRAYADFLHMCRLYVVEKKYIEDSE